MMDLIKANVTVASRIMVPAYIVLMTYYGFIYWVDPLERTKSSHALAFPRSLMAINYWGMLFIAIAIAMLIALRQKSRRGYIVALSTACSTWIMWAVMYTVSIFTDHQTSLLAPVGPLFYATCCIATMLSLQSRET